MMDPFILNVESVIFLLTGFSFSELSKHGCLVVQNKIQLVLHSCNYASALPRRV